MIEERNFILNSRIGGKQPFFIIAGPCVIESEDLLLKVCETLNRICTELGILFIFKSSFDKANRSDGSSLRGLGIDRGLRLLERVKSEFQVPITTDIHELSQVKMVASIVDVLQIPAFLCRQTNLLIECAETGKWVNVKKGQFIAPEDCKKIKEKIQLKKNNCHCLITERGVSFGYRNLIFDSRSIPIIHEYDLPFIIDATHSVQLPGLARESGGQRKYIETIARAAIIQGIEGLFFETHPNPSQAWSDSATQIPLNQAEAFIREMVRIDQFAKSLK